MLCKEMSLDFSADQTLEHALLRLKEGYFEDAVESFTLYLSLEPTNAKAYQGRALANFQMKNWPGALSDFQKAKELEPEDPENWVGAGMTLAMMNEVYEAIDIFEGLLKNQPSYARGHFQLGMLYYKLGVIKKGHEQMDLVLSSRPSLAERRLAEQVKNEQLTLDKKRFHRPDFEELRLKNKMSDSVFRQVVNFFKNKFRRQ